MDNAAIEIMNESNKMPTNIKKEENNSKQNMLDIIINNPLKMKCLCEANNSLHINNSLNKIIFVYSKPKVGSTTLITSLRIFASRIFNIVHIHDDEMLKVLGNIRDITVNEIILYNKIIGKQVYVIDIYRSPIERKISTFFEKINTYHYNVEIDKLEKYKIECIIERFNKIFPYIGNGDNFLDVYDIIKPTTFPYDKKYISIKEDDIKYIKLRLKESHLWETILQDELNVKIKIIRDYETSSKPVNAIYNNFKEHYKIPFNYLEDIKQCPYLNFYYSENEKIQYLNDWYNKTTTSFQPFTPDEFKLYEYICRENNNHTTFVQLNHYLDEGCICKACQFKRNNISNKIMSGEKIIDRIFHEEAKNELIENRLKVFNRVVNTLSKKQNIQQKHSNNRITNMKNIVNLR
jgi:hypothetical protein